MIQQIVETILKTKIPVNKDGKRQYRTVIKWLDAGGKFTKRTSDDLLIAILEYLDAQENAKKE